jgi:hypothetical protein
LESCRVGRETCGKRGKTWKRAGDDRVRREDRNAGVCLEGAGTNGKGTKELRISPLHFCALVFKQPPVMEPGFNPNRVIGLLKV